MEGDFPRVMLLDDQEAEIQQSELDLDEAAGSFDRSRRIQALDAVNDRWGGGR